MPSYSSLTVATGTVIAKTWADDVRDSVVNVFASSAARTSAIPTPTEGMVSYLSDVNALYVYDGTTWQQVAPKAVSAVNAVAGTTSSTSYTDTLTSSSTLSVAFVAPASGQVVVSLSVNQANSLSSSCTTSVRLSGATTVASSDDYSVGMFGANGFRQGTSHLFTGLTALGSYTATMQHKVGANSGTFTSRELIVMPA